MFHNLLIYKYLTITFNHLDSLFGAVLGTLSTARTTVGRVDKGSHFSLNNGAHQRFMPTNPYAIPAVTALVLVHMRYQISFLPKHISNNFI
jgi:hypothetical protein